MKTETIIGKLGICFTAGITVSALILVLGNSGNVPFLPPVLIFSFVGLAMISSIFFPFLWQNLEKNYKIDSYKVNAILFTLLRYCIAFNLASFGWKKLMGLQFVVPNEIAHKPLNSISGEWLTWYYFGFSKPFGYILAFIQIAGSFMLLYRKTLLLGAIILFTFMLNLLLVNIFYQMNAGALLQSIITTFGLIYLILTDYEALVTFFFKRKSELPTLNMEGVLFKNMLRISVLVVSLLLTFYYKSLV
jgi:hypothetical protein